MPFCLNFLFILFQINHDLYAILHNVALTVLANHYLIEIGELLIANYHYFIIIIILLKERTHCFIITPRAACQITSYLSNFLLLDRTDLLK
jgi:hypothetical protein